MSHPTPGSNAAGSPGIEIPDPEPDVLTARELVAEAREAVAKSRQLIARGRELRQQSELICKQFHQRARLKPRKSA